MIKYLLYNPHTYDLLATYELLPIYPTYCLINILIA
jgi:hypothetical protein